MSRWSVLLQQRAFAYLLVCGGASLAAPTGSLAVVSWALAHAGEGMGPTTSTGALALALLGLSSTLPTLITASVAGTFADRYDRRRLMQGVNLTALAATVGIAWILLHRPAGSWSVPFSGGLALPLWVVAIYPFWAVETTAITLFRPAFNASVPRLVHRPDLGSANGLIYAVALVLSIAAGLGASGLAAFVPWGYALAVPIALFGATQVALAWVDADLRPHREGPPRRFVSDAADGYRFLWARRYLFDLTIAALAVNFFSAVAFVELGLYATFWLKVTNPIVLGALISAGSLGAAVGALIVSRFKFERRSGRFLALCTVGQGLSVIALAFTPNAALALPAMFLFGVFPGMFTTVFLATIQSTVPDDKLGRVLAADEVGSYALVPAGQWVGGLLTLESGIQVSYLSAGIGTVLIGGLMVSVRDLRQLGYSPDGTGPAMAAGASASEPPG